MGSIGRLDPVAFVLTLFRCTVSLFPFVISSLDVEGHGMAFCKMLSEWDNTVALGFTGCLARCFVG